MTDPTYTKHTTHTDALGTLGTIIGPDETRDAIHLAVFPVEAAHRLRPGEHVALDDDGRAVMATQGQGVGVVDPFLIEYVPPGQRFWLVVYPRQITSLRHVWEHPAFPPSGETGAAAPSEPTATETKDEAELWLRDYLRLQGDNPGFDAVMAVIEHGSWSDGDTSYPSTGEYHDGWGDGPYLHFRGVNAHGEIAPEFWDHVRVFLGRSIPEDEQAAEFTCSC